MLVMTTIFISKMEGLPPTSDTKMIDIWLILCQLVPFAEVVLLTAMEFLREDEENSSTSCKNNVTASLTYVGNDDEIETKAPLEGWISPNKRGGRVATLTILRIIGE